MFFLSQIILFPHFPRGAKQQKGHFSHFIRTTTMMMMILPRTSTCSLLQLPYFFLVQSILLLFLLLLFSPTCSDAFRLSPSSRVLRTSSTWTATTLSNKVEQLMMYQQPLPKKKLLFYRSSTTRRRATVEEAAPEDAQETKTPSQCPVTQLSLRLKSWMASLWKILTFPLVRYPNEVTCSYQ